MILLHLDKLANAKNLLGFSAGVDSTCLFYLLLEAHIPFDMAIVDYNMRVESKIEVEHTRSLAKKHNKKLFLKEVYIEGGSFESKARELRYSFFEEIIKREGYTNLLLAHQLNDRIEWLLMQLMRGSGLSTMLGFDSIEQREGYSIIRPLSNISRDEILAYLAGCGAKYFIDKSNDDESFTRNHVRKHYANKLVSEHRAGLLKSLEYLRADFVALYKKGEIKCVRGIYLIKRLGALSRNMSNSEGMRIDSLRDLHNISLVAKRLNYVISKAQRDEIEKSGYSCVIAGKIVIDSNKEWIFMLRDFGVETGLESNKELGLENLESSANNLNLRDNLLDSNASKGVISDTIRGQNLDFTRIEQDLDSKIIDEIEQTLDSKNIKLDSIFYARHKLERFTHSKKFRDSLRRANIPPKIRPFINDEILEEMRGILGYKG